MHWQSHKDVIERLRIETELANEKTLLLLRNRELRKKMAELKKSNALLTGCRFDGYTPIETNSSDRTHAE